MAIGKTSMKTEIFKSARTVFWRQSGDAALAVRRRRVCQSWLRTGVEHRPGILQAAPLETRSCGADRYRSGLPIHTSEDIRAAIRWKACWCGPAVLARIESGHVKDSPEACAAVTTSFNFPALSASMGRYGTLKRCDSSSRNRQAARGSRITCSTRSIPATSSPGPTICSAGMCALSSQAPANEPAALYPVVDRRTRDLQPSSCLFGADDTERQNPCGWFDDIGTQGVGNLQLRANQRFELRGGCFNSRDDC
jgi:hypothetical protein